MLIILLKIGAIWLLYNILNFYLKIFFSIFKDAFKKINEEINQKKGVKRLCSN